MTDHKTKNEIDLELMGKIVSAYVTNNAIPAVELTRLMADVHSAIVLLAMDESELEESLPKQKQMKPAVPIKNSVHHDHLICLEDGKKFRSLKRHIEAHHGMTPEEYRSKWGLPASYPMTAPGYSELRSTLAKASGLGLTPDVPRAKRARKPTPS